MILLKRIEEINSLIDYVEGYVNLLSEIIGKTECVESRIGLKRILGLSDSKRITYTDLDYFRGLIINNFVDKSKKDRAKNHPDFPAFDSKLKKFKKALGELNELILDKDITGFLKYQDSVGNFTFDKESYEEMHVDILALHSEITRLTKNPAKRGRASLHNLYGFVFHSAARFIEITGMEFTIYRHKDEKESYQPITVAHQFIFCLVQYINEEISRDGGIGKYTDKNIYNACEEAQRWLREDSKPR